jgi:hypothetical protein
MPAIGADFNEKSEKSKIVQDVNYTGTAVHGEMKNDIIVQ